MGNSVQFHTWYSLEQMFVTSDNDRPNEEMLRSAYLKTNNCEKKGIIYKAKILKLYERFFALLLKHLVNHSLSFFKFRCSVVSFELQFGLIKF